MSYDQEYKRSYVNELFLPLNKTNVLSRLGMLQLNGKKLLMQIKKWKCLIAGSFPLQCLLNEFYKDSDIDIYVKYNKDFDNIHPIEEWLCSYYKTCAMDHHYMIDGVFKSTRYNLRTNIKEKRNSTVKTIVNIVIVKTKKSLEQFIYDNFDLSFCMTIINGEGLLYNELSKLKIGYVANTKKNKYSQVIGIQKLRNAKEKKNSARLQFDDFNDLCRYYASTISHDKSDSDSDSSDSSSDAEQIFKNKLPIITKTRNLKYSKLRNADVLDIRINKYTCRGFRILEKINYKPDNYIIEKKTHKRKFLANDSSDDSSHDSNESSNGSIKIKIKKHTKDHTNKNIPDDKPKRYWATKQITSISVEKYKLWNFSITTDI